MIPCNPHQSTAPTPQVLETLRLEIDRLEAELKRHQQETAQMRAERDEARFMVEHLKKFIRDLPEWEKFDPSDYKYTLADIVAVLHAH